MSELVLNINKVAYSGWAEAHIHTSMDEISGAFIVSIANFFHDIETPPDIAIGDACTIEIDDQKILTGYIELLEQSYGEDFDFVILSGRDKTGDLVDCSYDSTVNEWKGQTVENLIKNLCNPFDISVVVDSSVVSSASTIIDAFKSQEGESVFEIIAELCRMNSILPIRNEDGELLLTEAAQNKYTNNGIEKGVNVIEGRMILNDEDRYSSYSIKGQGIGNDNKAILDFSEPSGTVNDPITSRYRPLIMLAETPTNNGQCKDRARWESRLRAGNSRLLQYTILDWVQDNGDVWKINELIRVKDDFFRIEDTRLIKEIDFYYDEEIGEKTVLTLVDKDAYKLTEDTINIKMEFDR